MSAKFFSRDYAQGKVKKLQRMKPGIRNPVVFALAHRAITVGVGKHIRGQGATRRAERVALQKLVRQLEV